MEKVNLVLGANGHLGNNLVRLLLKKGEKVRAGVRKMDNQEPFQNLDCDRVYTELMDKDSLISAMKSIDTLYIAAAVYKSWAKDIQKEIVNVNIEGTRSILEAASIQEVKKIIYVSTTFTLDHHNVPINVNGWNNDKSDPYAWSKTEAEKLVWELAKKYNLDMVSVLPSGMIGPHCYGHLTPTMEVITKISNNQLPFDPCFNFNFIDIHDVAKTITVASEKGKPGERYILAQENPISSTEVFQIARSHFPNVKIPKKATYRKMIVLASIMSAVSKVTRRQPLLLPSLVRKFYQADWRFDVSKSKRDLGLNPKPSAQVLKETMEYIYQKKQKEN